MWVRFLAMRLLGHRCPAVADACGVQSRKFPSSVDERTGNKSATFPLQLLEWDVDVLNTVQLSNHTGECRILRASGIQASQSDRDHEGSPIATMQDLVRCVADGQHSCTGIVESQADPSLRCLP